MLRHSGHCCFSLERGKRPNTLQTPDRSDRTKLWVSQKSIARWAATLSPGGRHPGLRALRMPHASPVTACDPMGGWVCPVFKHFVSGTAPISYLNPPNPSTEQLRNEPETIWIPWQQVTYLILIKATQGVTCCLSHFTDEGMRPQRG